MEKKSNHNLEKYRFTNLLTGFCYVSGIMLAAFSYGNMELITNKKQISSLNMTEIYLDQNEKPKEIKQPPSPPKVSNPKPKLDLNQETKPIKKDVVVQENPKTDVNTNNDNKTDTNSVISNTNTVTVSNEVSDFPDVEAEFIGGYDAWKNFLLGELIYPEISIEFSEQGVVYVSFVIEIDGKISDVKIIKGVSRDIDREAIRVIKKSPKWIPGKVNNQVVRTRVTVPINFVLQ